MTAFEKLSVHLSGFPTAPVLFIGSGFSRRYLGLETWEGLLSKFSALTPMPYAYYRANSNSDLPLVASSIAEELNKVWWTDEAFKESREKFSHLCTAQSSALKIEISQYLSDRVNKFTVPDALCGEIESLKEIVVDGIITTNWDQLLENLFPDFRPYIGQEELLFGAPQGISEIYKIHGCASKPDSLVITKDDYDTFHRKNPYLAAKLLATFIEHPVIFIGYSLSDPNITSIISAISNCLDGSSVSKLQDRLLFVEWAPSISLPSFEGASLSQNGVTIPIKVIKTSDFTPIYACLKNIQRRFPAKILRLLKEKVYDLVLNGDPHGRMYVKDIDSATSDDDIDIVFGVGAIRSLEEKGHVGLSRLDLLRDVVFDGATLAPSRVIHFNLGGFLSSASYVPVFKYLREAGYFDADSASKLEKLPPAISSAAKRTQLYFMPPAYYRTVFRKNFSATTSLEDLISKKGKDTAIKLIPLLDPSLVDMLALSEFLRAEFDNQISNPIKRSEFSRLVCFYDWIKYGFLRTGTAPKSAIAST